MSISRTLPSFVYLIETQMGVLKIGCSTNPASRAGTVHAHSPSPSRLIAQWPGKIRDENALHRRFAAYCSHSEWYRIEGDVASFVADMRGVGVASIPDWDDITAASKAARVRISHERKAAAMRAAWADPDQRRNFLWRRERPAPEKAA